MKPTSPASYYRATANAYPAYAPLQGRSEARVAIEPDSQTATPFTTISTAAQATDIMVMRAVSRAASLTGVDPGRSGASAALSAIPRSRPTFRACT